MRVSYISFKLSLFFVVFAALITPASAQDIQKPHLKSATSFAIVVDQATYGHTKKEVDSYRDAIERSGLATYLISGDWKKPEEIRSILEGLYQQSQPLEGTVLIGDIPIAMVRDAQYLTSTFKMNQKINWQRSSVPSDRFYDDFHLKFDFIKQDTAQKNYFYYSISPEGPQKIHMSIYSARIKPPVIAGKDKYQLIREYLQKVVADKSVKNKLNNVFISSSHGYNSESPNSWAGEQLAFKGQFPELFKPGNQVRFFTFQNADFLKFNLLSALKNPELDMAIMHGHGDTDMQMINGYPNVSHPQGSIDNLTRYLRSKMRDAKESKRDLQKVKEGFVKSLGVPMAWMDNAFDPKVVEADSIFVANQDIHIKDIVDHQPNARFVMLDNCFTGSFHLDEYLAGYYPFSGGKNIVAVANSIGVLQDLWPDQLLGTLQHGTRVGNWFKHIAYLETHIMGDPTFSYESNSALDLNKAITAKNSLGYWNKILAQPDADVQALALIYLGELMDRKAYSSLLKKTHTTSPYETTRMQAFQLLKELNNNDYLEVLMTATRDPYEFIRRRAVYEIAEEGTANFIPALINMLVEDSHSERIDFRVRFILPFMDAKEVLSEIDKQYIPSRLIHFEEKKEELKAMVTSSDKKVREMIDTILDKSKTDKIRLFEIVTMRAYRYHQIIPALASTAKDAGNSDAVRLAALEALSWFPKSYRRDEVIAVSKEVEQNTANSEELRKQARKNLNIFS